MVIKSGYKENGSPTMEIKTDRLIIRPLGPEYLETYNAYAMSLENARYMCFLPQKDEEESMEFLKAAAEEWLKPDPKFYEFAIIHNGEHIGGISVHMEYGKPVLGWIINKDYWGQGFAYESAKAVMDHFTKELGIRYFCAYCDTRNTASFKLMEKLGMRRAGESGGRRNRASSEEASEYKYEIIIG
jgi:RimJ/RimL family protein N-acetyltransferase